MGILNNLGLIVTGWKTTYWRHTFPFIGRNAVKHANRSRPLEGDPDPLPHLRELASNAGFDLSILARRLAQQDQKLKATSWTSRGALQRARDARVHAGARHRESTRRHRERHGEPPALTGGTRKTGYRILLVVLTILETFINSRVFVGILGALYGAGNYGDFELWGFSLVVALLLIVTGHYLGLHLRNERQWPSRTKVITAVVIAGIVIALVSSLVLRAADPAQSLGIALAFTGLNVALFTLGLFASYLRHLEGAEDVVTTRKQLEKARRDEARADDAFKVAQTNRQKAWEDLRAEAMRLRELHHMKANAFKDVLLLNWKQGEPLPEALNTDLVIPLPEVFQALDHVPDLPEAPMDEAYDLEPSESSDSDELNDTVSGDGAMPAAAPVLS